MTLTAICVYCASSPGADAAFVEAASDFGRLLAGRGTKLVYGGGQVGLMGALADAALSAGGEVSGVITRALEAKEIAHTALSSLRVVETMHERKAAMADEADAFVMLPGGFGTYEEFLEAVTWTQLGVHTKPCGVLNVRGFFDPLLALMEAATNNRFLRAEHRDIVTVESDAALLLERMEAWTPVVVDKWIDRQER